MGKLPHSINTGNQYTHAEKANSNLVHLHNTDQSRHEAQSQGRGQSPGHRAGCQDCPGLDGCQHHARGHPGVQGGAQYRAAEERGDKASRGDPATSGLCIFSSGLIYCTNNTTGRMWSCSPMWPSLKSTGCISIWSPPSSRDRLDIEIWFQAEIAPIIEKLDFMDILYLDSVLPSLCKV